jgi:hypothetical protein
VSDADQLLAELRVRAGRRARLSIDAVWEAFRLAVRGYTGNVEARPRLAQLLTALQAAGGLELPRSKDRWDRTAEPPLPKWVQLVVERSPHDTYDPREIAWPPELAFASDLPRVPMVRDLLAVRRFLANGGRESVLAPLRERSLEIFGDEKRLGNLRKTSLFAPGRLSLDVLRCYEVAPPLVWEPGPDQSIGRPVLVLENLDTYDSFCRWNVEAAEYGAVAYGHGSEFLATVRDLPRVCQSVAATTAEYFGDIDHKGLQIPLHAQLVLARDTPDITLRPAVHWYAELLGYADLSSASGEVVGATDPALAWLPDDLRSGATKLLAAGRRLPQGHIGAARLRKGECLCP